MLLLAPFVAVGAICLAIIADFLVPGSEIRALQASTAEARLPGCHKLFGVSAGSCTLGLGSWAVRFTDAPAEVQTALKTVRGVDFALYGLGKAPAGRDLDTLVKEADRRMEKQGWERAVLVRERGNLVAIYNKTNVRRAEDLRVCVLVVEDREIVMVSARADLRPVIQYLQDSGKWPKGGLLFSQSK